VPDLGLSYSANEALAFARWEAQCHGIPAVFTAHLLVGLLRVRDAAVEHVLAEVGLEAEAVISALGLQPSGEDALPRGPEPHLTDQCANAVAAACQEALVLGGDSVRPEHLMLGIVTTEEAWAGHVLARLGVQPDRVRLAIRSLGGIRLLRAADPVEVSEAYLMRPAASNPSAQEQLLHVPQSPTTELTIIRKEPR
jgi:ATP-dependent Clp protease ATP-binding subunit ClpA